MIVNHQYHVLESRGIEREDEGGPGEGDQVLSFLKCLLLVEGEEEKNE